MREPPAPAVGAPRARLVRCRTKGREADVRTSLRGGRGGGRRERISQPEPGRTGVEAAAQRPRLPVRPGARGLAGAGGDRKSTRLNSSHVKISYAVFC